VCYPLHGSDVDESTDAVSAGLGWVCSFDKDFTGAEDLRKIKADGPDERLSAFVMDEPAVPRAGMSVVESGRVTSGTHSPMLDCGIGLAYLPASGASPGEKIQIDVRGKHRAAHVVQKPIYKREEHVRGGQ
jgi:aminomethyltransferase